MTFAGAGDSQFQAELPLKDRQNVLVTCFSGGFSAVALSRSPSIYIFNDLFSSESHLICKIGLITSVLAMFVIHVLT